MQLARTHRSWRLGATLPCSRDGSRHHGRCLFSVRNAHYQKAGPTLGLVNIYPSSSASNHQSQAKGGVYSGPAEPASPCPISLGDTRRMARAFWRPDCQKCNSLGRSLSRAKRILIDEYRLNATRSIFRRKPSNPRCSCMANKSMTGFPFRKPCSMSLMFELRKAVSRLWRICFLRYVVPTVFSLLSLFVLDWVIAFIIPAVCRSRQPYEEWHPLRLQEWKWMWELPAVLATWILTTSYVFVVAYLSTTDDIAVNLEPKAADDGKYQGFPYQSFLRRS